MNQSTEGNSNTNSTMRTALPLPTGGSASAAAACAAATEEEERRIKFVGRKRQRERQVGRPWRRQRQRQRRIKEHRRGILAVQLQIMLAGVILLVLLLVLLPESISAQEVLPSSNNNNNNNATGTILETISSTLSPSDIELAEIGDNSNSTAIPETSVPVTAVPLPVATIMPTPPPAPAPVLPPTTSYFSVTAWFSLLFDYTGVTALDSTAGFLNATQLVSFQTYMESLTQQFADEEEWQKVVTMCNHIEVTQPQQLTEPPILTEPPFFFNESTSTSAALVVSSTSNDTETFMVGLAADDNSTTSTAAPSLQQQDQQHFFEYRFQMIYLSSAVNVSFFPSRLEDHVNSPTNLPNITLDLQTLLGLSNSSNLNITTFQEVPPPQNPAIMETLAPTVAVTTTTTTTTTTTSTTTTSSSPSIPSTGIGPGQVPLPVATISPSGYPSISVEPSTAPSTSMAPSVSSQPSDFPSMVPSTQPTGTPSGSPTMYPTYVNNITAVNNFALDFTLQAPDGAGYLNETQEDMFCDIMANQTIFFAATPPVVPDPSIADRVQTICIFFSDTYVRTTTQVPIPTEAPSQAPSASNAPSTSPTEVPANTRKGGTDKNKKGEGRHRSLLSSLTSFLRTGRNRMRKKSFSSRRSLQPAYTTTIYTYTYTFRIRYLSQIENVTDYTNLFQQHIAANAIEFNVMLTDMLGLTPYNNLTLTSISIFSTKSASPTYSMAPSQSPTNLPTVILPLPSYAPTPTPSRIPSQVPTALNDMLEDIADGGDAGTEEDSTESDTSTSSAGDDGSASGGSTPQEDNSDQTTIIIVVVIVASVASVIMIGMVWFYKFRRQTKLEQEAAQQNRRSSHQNDNSNRGGHHRRGNSNSHHPYDKQLSHGGDPLGNGSYHSTTGKGRILGGGTIGIHNASGGGALNTVATSPTTYVSGDLEGYGGIGGTPGGAMPTFRPVSSGGVGTPAHRLLMSPSTSESILSNPSLLSNGQEEDDDDEDDDDDVVDQNQEHDVDDFLLLQQRHQSQLSLSQQQLYAKFASGPPTIDDFDQFKDHNLEKMRSDVEESVKGIDGMMSQALTMAILSGTTGSLTSSGRSLVMEGDDGIEIEANALCEVTDWVKRHNPSSSTNSSTEAMILDERHAFMQDILNKMVASVRQGIMGPDEASRTIHECAALLRLQLTTELPNTTVILTGMRKNVRAHDVIRTFRKFGPIEDAAVASNQRGFGFVRFRSSKTVEQVMMKFRTHEIVVQDVAVQCKRLKPTDR